MLFHHILSRFVINATSSILLACNTIVEYVFLNTKCSISKHSQFDLTYRLLVCSVFILACCKNTSFMYQIKACHDRVLHSKLVCYIKKVCYKKNLLLLSLAIASDAAEIQQKAPAMKYINIVKNMFEQVSIERPVNNLYVQCFFSTVLV